MCALHMHPKCWMSHDWLHSVGEGLKLDNIYITEGRKPNDIQTLNSKTSISNCNVLTRV